MSDLKEMEHTYAVPIKKWGEYVKVENKGRNWAVIFHVRGQSFEINSRSPKHEALWMRIMFCQALNVAVTLQQEGIDTSDSPETDFTNAIVGKFYRGGPLLPIAYIDGPYSKWPRKTT